MSSSSLAAWLNPQAEFQDLFVPSAATTAAAADKRQQKQKQKQEQKLIDTPKSSASAPSSTHSTELPLNPALRRIANKELKQKQAVSTTIATPSTAAAPPAASTAKISVASAAAAHALAAAKALLHGDKSSEVTVPLSADEATAQRQAKREKRKREDAEFEALDTDAIRASKKQKVSAHKDLRAMFASCGTIESIRFRSFSPQDPKLPRRATAITKQFHSERDNMNAYIVFASEASIEEGLKLNGQLLDEHAIRVDRCGAGTAPVKYESKRTVFLGSLPFNVLEDEVREHFAACGEIEAVRIVRDRDNSMGKGFGFVLFKAPSSLKLALALHRSKMKDRQIRVTQVVSEEKLERMRERATKGSAASATGTSIRSKSASGSATPSTGGSAARAADADSSSSAKSASIKARAYEGEHASPEEFARRQRRLEKKKRKRKEARQVRRSLVKPHRSGKKTEHADK